MNDLGTLQRFHKDIDAEYALDLISSQFGLSEEYQWHQRPNGARYWAGSINQRVLVAGFDLKASVPLGDRWSVAVRFNQEDGPQIARNLVRIRFRRDWQGVFGFAEASLHTDKPESDVTLGVGVRDRAGTATVSLTMLDAFSDFIYQTLVVWHGFADTALDYEQQPFAVRASLERSLGRHLRIEGNAALLLPSRVRAYRQLAPDTGFRQAERFGLASLLLEWSFSPSVRTGAFATYVRAVSDRTPLREGRALDDFRLVEKTTRLGAFTLAQLTRKWRIETWVAREARPEQRTYRGAARDVDYEDRAWSGQATLGYRAIGGFRANTAFEMDLRDVVRADGPVPSIQPLGEHNIRLRFDLGWQFGTTVALTAGYRVDLDFDRAWFDGAHGSFVLYW